jgi:xylan 1,4-beta-xylosidase
MLTWAFQFENREYFEGLRTLSTNGIDKPVLSVFRMLSRLGGSRLRLDSDRSRDPLSREGADTPAIAPDISGVAAMDGNEAIQVFVASHHDDWDLESTTEASLVVSGLRPGDRYNVSRWILDSRRGNSYRVWVDMGEPRHPNASQLERLRRAAAPGMQPAGSAQVRDDGTVEVSLAVESHSVILVELVPAR